MPSADQAPTITAGVSKNAISKMERSRLSIHKRRMDAWHAWVPNQADTWYAGLSSACVHTHRDLSSWDWVLL